LDDKAIIDGVLKGDSRSERALYDMHVERVHGLAYRMAGDPALAQDFTQDAFVRIFEALPGFRGESSLGTWIQAVAVSVIINGLRKVKRYRTRIETRDDLTPVETGVRPGNPELKRLLSRKIDELPDILRITLILYEVEGYRHEEIARMLAIPEGTSRARLSRARAILREGLEDRLYAGADGRTP
jgi:RNA polymerase sigma-70 factor (ECF subfamily)